MTVFVSSPPRLPNISFLSFKQCFLLHHQAEKTRARTMAPCLFSSCCGKRSSSAAKHEEGCHDDDNAAAATEDEAARDGPVVVELFSSQGCATSPEAELLFSRIGRGDWEVLPLILLGFHVDYWDYTGWKDPFGCSQWTVRQKSYVESLQLDTMFTPLMVVQGQDQCVGNDQDAVLTSIKSAPRFPPLSLQVITHAVALVAYMMLSFLLLSCS